MNSKHLWHEVVMIKECSHKDNLLTIISDNGQKVLKFKEKVKTVLGGSRIGKIYD